MTVRMRHTRSHTKNRRSHHALAEPALSKDEHGHIHLRHRLSKESGNYRGRKIIDLTAKLKNLPADKARQAKTTK